MGVGWLSRILNWPQANWFRRAIPEYACVSPLVSLLLFGCVVLGVCLCLVSLTELFRPYTISLAGRTTMVVIAGGRGELRAARSAFGFGSASSDSEIIGHFVYIMQQRRLMWGVVGVGRGAVGSQKICGCASSVI